MSIAIVHLTIHEWDTDNKKIKLPKKVIVKIEIKESGSIGGIHDDALEKARDENGFVVLGSTLDRIDFK